MEFCKWHKYHCYSKWEFVTHEKNILNKSRWAIGANPGISLKIHQCDLRRRYCTARETVFVSLNITVIFIVVYLYAYCLCEFRFHPLWLQAKLPQIVRRHTMEVIHWSLKDSNDTLKLPFQSNLVFNSCCEIALILVWLDFVSQHWFN